MLNDYPIGLPHELIRNFMRCAERKNLVEYSLKLVCFFLSSFLFFAEILDSFTLLAKIEKSSQESQKYGSIWCEWKKKWVGVGWNILLKICYWDFLLKYSRIFPTRFKLNFRLDWLRLKFCYNLFFFVNFQEFSSFFVNVQEFSPNPFLSNEKWIDTAKFKSRISCEVRPKTAIVSP